MSANPQEIDDVAETIHENYWIFIAIVSESAPVFRARARRVGLFGLTKQRYEHRFAV